ncbi:MAG: hypothetical protein ACKOAO_09310 [Oxalobacteraceae bacterium]
MADHATPHSRSAFTAYAACAALTTCLLGGCAELGYYAQAARGQMSLLAGAKPIERWLSDPAG